MSDYINELYSFLENPSKFMDKSIKDINDIEIFLNPNLVVLHMIINAIEKTDMIKKIESYNKEKAFELLSQTLENELSDIPNIEQYKIDICNIKLLQLLDKIYVYKKDKKDLKKSKVKGDMYIKNSVITLTFGDQAENHVGMEKIGKMVGEGQGFNIEDLRKIQERMESIGAETELYNISELSYKNEKDRKNNKRPDAYILVIKNGVDIILRDLELDEKVFNKDNLFYEQASLNVDKQAFMYGRVVNKNARWNLCFDEKAKEPDYEMGKGRVIAFSDVPITKSIVDSMSRYFGEKARDLKGEGNYYYDIGKCGIGFHGDSERRKVLAIRLGTRLDIHYQWFKEGETIGKRVIVPLNGGDIYLMSEKAVGTDWKKKKIYTLRHATGCDKFINI